MVYGEFNVTLPPSVPAWPELKYLVQVVEDDDPWEYRDFPQDIWKKHDPDCTKGLIFSTRFECDYLSFPLGSSAIACLFHSFRVRLPVFSTRFECGLDRYRL